MSDLIERQSAIDAVSNMFAITPTQRDTVEDCLEILEDLPSAQPDIIRCNSCKHWTQTTGNMPGFGLGDCDYLNAKLVSCNGFCYWAERRTDEDD